MPTKDRVKMVVSSLELKEAKPSTEFNGTLKELQLSEKPRELVRYCNDKGIKSFEIRTEEGILSWKPNPNKANLKERAKERGGPVGVIPVG